MSILTEMSLRTRSTENSEPTEMFLMMNDGAAPNFMKYP